jgi:hypothetical protein
LIDDDDHVDGMKLRLCTATTNGPNVHIGDTYEHGGPRWNDIDRGKLLIRPAEFFGSSTSSHLVSTEEDMVKEMNFAYEISLL